MKIAKNFYGLMLFILFGVIIEKLLRFSLIKTILNIGLFLIPVYILARHFLAKKGYLLPVLLQVEDKKTRLKIIFAFGLFVGTTFPTIAIIYAISTIVYSIYSFLCNDISILEVIRNA